MFKDIWIIASIDETFDILTMTNHDPSSYEVCKQHFHKNQE